MKDGNNLGHQGKPFRLAPPPVCPRDGVPLRCERTKTECGFKTQYRYCPICGHPQQVVTRIEETDEEKS